MSERIGNLLCFTFVGYSAYDPNLVGEPLTLAVENDFNDKGGLMETRVIHFHEGRPCRTITYGPVGRDEPRRIIAEASIIKPGERKSWKEISAMLFLLAIGGIILYWWI